MVGTSVGRLWPHQVEAVDSITTMIGRGGRASIHMACGTGKTRVGGAVAAELGGRRRVLVVLPTIELLVQTLESYRAVGDGPLGQVIAVCSDPSIADLELLEGEPDVVVTTNAGELADAASGRTRMTVLSTYASLAVIAAAHANHKLRVWDLMVVDEAHRTTGRADGPWKVVHHDAQIPARRRLYMTATPRIADRGGEDVVSMDDTTIYGRVAHRLPFSRAIDLGLLADYRVVVPVVTDQEVHRLTTDENLSMRLGGSSLPPSVLACQIAVLRTMNEYGVRRAISYHHRVSEAKRWAHALPATAGIMPGGPIQLWAGHVSGMQAPHLRRRVIERLADPGSETVVVSNAKVLNEGIDVPAVDAVVFTRPRESAIDTIQAVGRALRTGGQVDKVATIVVPLLLSAGESPEAALEGSDWEPVWQVIRALRDHDDRLDDYLRVRRTQLGEGTLFEPGSREVKLPPWLSIEGVDVPDAFAEAITIRALRASSPSWDEYFGAARAYAYLHGHPNMPTNWISPGGLKVGQWIGDQRKHRKNGRLTSAREVALESINIIWDVIDELWMTAFEHARKFHVQHGHLDIPQAMLAEDGYRLGVWIGWQRRAHHAGKLAPERMAALDELGMVWNPSRTAWERGYDEAVAYHDRHGHLAVPAGHTTPSGHKLGTWIVRQRKLFENKKLTAEQVTMLDEAGMIWRPLDHAWQQAYQHACAFRERNGHLDVIATFKTGDGFRLGNWIINQRQAHRDNQLAADKVKALEDLGIVWNPLDAKWEHGLTEARHYKDMHKDLRVHAKYLTVSGYKLGGWIADQRKAHAAGRLPPHRVDKLNELGMSWTVPDDTWKIAYDELRVYRDTHGDLDLPVDFMSTSGINLYSWAGTQRASGKNGTLSDDRRRLLDDIEFPWDLELARWMRRYRQVSDAMGETKSPRSLPPGSPERIWLDNQAISYRKNRLDPQRRQLLEAIGVTDNLVQALWLSTYEELAAFKREEGHFAVPADYETIDGISLTTWINNQRKQRAAGSLSNEKLNLLNRIEFPWDAHTVRNWDPRYAEAVEFARINGHLQPPPSSPLRTWLLRQKRNHDNGILSRTHQLKLLTLDPNWTQMEKHDNTETGQS